MTFPWVDQTEGDFQREQEAADRASHLQLVRSELAGGGQAADDEVMRLAVDFADVTDAVNFVLAHYEQTSEKFPTFNRRERCFLDAVAGATAGRTDYVEITDEELAARMGCSTKTVQRARDSFRAWPEYGKLLGIKDNWQHPETKESHPHAYNFHLGLMAAAATADARLSPRYGSEDDRLRVFKESAKMRATAAQGSMSRPPKRRRKPTPSELLLSDVGRAASALENAVKRDAHHYDPDELQALRDRAAAALEALDAAYGLSMQKTDTEERKVDKRGGETPDEQGHDRRMDSPAVEPSDKMSTQNGSTDSITYEFEVEGDWDVSRYVWVEDGRVCWNFPPDNAPPWFLEEYDRRLEELRGSRDV
jgi:hypothetical protein